MIETPFSDARIVVVDDEPANVTLLERLLEQAGYRNLVPLVDSSRTVDVVAEQATDLVLLDLHMPGLDGFEVMSRLAPWTVGDHYLPILMLTADVSVESRRRALAMGARDFLTKPLDPAEVVLRVRNTLETRRLQLRLERHNDELERRVRDRTAELERARLETLERLARAAEYRDDSTYRHAQRIGHSAGLLGRQLGLAPDAVALIRQAAPLHDVGKVAVSDAVLLKPGRLTEQEFEAVKVHCAAGAGILAGSDSAVLRTAEQIALTHHERWDGSGYPTGLRGEQIPIAGRIVALVDVFDALTHDRPYKQAWPLEEALEEIRRGTGAHFDPDVVEAFAALDVAELVEPARASAPVALAEAS